MLQAVRQRGHVACGVGAGMPGYSDVDKSGKWIGIAVDFCRALAAAVLGKSEAVQFHRLSAADRFTALATRAVDVLLHPTEWTLSRDTSATMRFVVPLFVDGEGVLVRRTQAVSSVLELSGGSICAARGSLAGDAVRHYFGVRQMRFTLDEHERWVDAVGAYVRGGCYALSASASALAAARQALDKPQDHVILPELLSRSLFGPAVRPGDEVWSSIVRWVYFALVRAEELGLTSAKAAASRASNSAEVRRLLDSEKAVSMQLGLSPRWAYDAIAQVGSYGEIYDRHFGERSAQPLRRGANAIAANGGLHLSPAFR